MSDDSKARGYRDALQPAAEELGRVLQIMARTVNMTLAPVHATVWGFELFRDNVATPMAGRIKKGMGAFGEMLDEMDIDTPAGAVGKMVDVISPVLFARKPSSDDLAYSPGLETRALGEDQASLAVDSEAEEAAYQFDFAVSTPATYTLQTRSNEDLVMGLFCSEPPYRRITYKDDGGEGRNPLIRRELEPDTYFLVVKRFGGEPYKGGFELLLAPEPEDDETCSRDSTDGP